MTLLAMQPAEKGAQHRSCIEAISLRASMFARHCDARWMRDVSLHSARLQPCAGQKPSRPAS